MGLFSKKKREPLVHPAVTRSIEVPATAADVRHQLDAYSALHSPRHGQQIVVRIGEGATDRTVVALPEQMHPWTFHNIGFWLLDTPNAADGLVLRSGADGTNPPYSLVRDPEMSDCLCGVDSDGTGWTVHVPGNEIAKGEPVPGTAGPPSMTEPTCWTECNVLVEDPQHDLNPTNASTAKSRKGLIPRHYAY